MSENYPSDVKLNENQDGTVSFATEVVATIAGLAATEVEGVASMSSPSSGLADMFSRKNTRNFTKGVRIDLDGNKVTVDITIVVEYGSPVPDVARNIQENVKKAIETMSGLDVKSVDIHVSGISFEREQRANAELNEQHRKMLEKTAEAAADGAPAPEASDLEVEEEEYDEDEAVEEEEDDEEIIEDEADDCAVEEDDEFTEESPEDIPEEEEEEIPVVEPEPEPEAPVEKAPDPAPVKRAPQTPAEPSKPAQAEPKPQPAPVQEVRVIEDEPEIIPGEEEPEALRDAE